MSCEAYLKASKRDIFEWECIETTDGYGMAGVLVEGVCIEGREATITKECDDEFEVDIILKYQINYNKDNMNTYEVIDGRSNRKSARMLAERLIKDDMKKDIIISEEQISKMKHCLGLDYKKKPFRNRFICSQDDELWKDLVNKKLAKMLLDNGFMLTKFGAEYIYGRNMSDKFYEEL